MLNNLFNENLASIGTNVVIFASIASIVFGLIIALAYKLTSQYSKNFLITITLLPLMVATVILLVNGNLGAGIATAGAFSLVRFRSMPGTSKEILVVFFAMAVGLALGMGYIYLAGCVTLIGSLAIVIFSKVPLFEKNKFEKHLKITIPEDLDYTEVFDEVLEKYTKSYELVNVKTTALGSMFELKYIITLNKKMNEKEFIDELRIKNGNLKIILTQPVNSEEL